MTALPPRPPRWCSGSPRTRASTPPTRRKAAYAALVQDLAQMQKDKTTGMAGTRINYSVPGTISLFKQGAPRRRNLQPPYKRGVAGR